MPDNESLSSLADEVLYGTEAIAAELNLSRTQVYYRLETGVLPAKKIGGIWTTTRTALRRYYTDNIDLPSPTPAHAEPAPPPQRRKKLRLRPRTGR